MVATMIDPEIEKAINSQINQELGAAHNYLAMSAYFDAKNLDGFATWMRVQHEEEQAHAMRLFRYLLDRGGKLDLDSIAKPVAEFESTMEVFKKALSQEVSNTKSINNLYELATLHNDHATKSHLQWFLDEQVEEESTIEEIIGLLELAGSDTSALLFLNDKLGSRQPEEVPEGA